MWQQLSSSPARRLADVRPSSGVKLLQTSEDGIDRYGLPTRWVSLPEEHRPRRLVWRLNTASFLRGERTIDPTPELPDRFNIVSSIPDISEVRPAMTASEYERWTVEMARSMLRLLPPDQVCILYQTPGRFSGEGGAWLDKGFLCQLGARRAGAACVWQKIVLADDCVGRRRGGTRAGFIQLLCFSKRHRVARDACAIDVLADRGHMSYSHAMGEAAVATAIEYTLQMHDDEAARLPVVDFFCGYGSVLAVANAYGLDAYGMDISLKCCRRAAAHSALVRPETPIEHSKG